MKLNKVLCILALASISLGAFAQEHNCCGESHNSAPRYYVGGQAGIISVYTDHFNAAREYFALEAGTWINPVLGARVSLAGPVQHFDEHMGIWMEQGKNLWSKDAYFGELNLDAMVNIVSLFNHKCHHTVDAYAFFGPTANFGTKGSKYTGKTGANGTLYVEECKDFAIRFGATVGAGVLCNINAHCALGLEYRAGVTPSVFGDIDWWRDASFTHRINLQFVYTFGHCGGCKSCK